MKLIQTFAIIFFMCLASTAISAQATPDYIATQEKPTISIPANHPTFTIKLKSNPTTGYTWSLLNYDHKLISLQKHTFQHGDPALIGAPGFEFWIFKAKPAAFSSPHQTILRFSYTRSWEHDVDATPVVFRVNIGLKK